MAKKEKKQKVKKEKGQKGKKARKERAPKEKRYAYDRVMGVLGASVVLYAALFLAAIILSIVYAALF